MTSDEFIAAALRNPANKIIVDELFHLALPDAWLVSGCLVQTVWNVLTGRAVDHGIADYDVFYFDRDTSWEAEDSVIRRLDDIFRKLRVKVEARNQARVHIWFEPKFGEAYAPLTHTGEAVGRFTTVAFAVGVRLMEDDRLKIVAPFGLEDMFALRLRPNPTRATAGFARTAANVTRRWPELTVEGA